MKNYKILFLASLLVFVLSACGGSKNNEVDSKKGSDSTFIIMKEDEPEEETVVGVMPEEVPNPENGHWRPPFKIKCSGFYNYEIKVFSNGLLRGTVHWTDPVYGTKQKEDFEGVWTTTSFARGESSQKAYVLSGVARARGDIYMPDDCKYLWKKDAIFNTDPYYEMANNMKDTGFKIESVENIPDE